MKHKIKSLHAVERKIAKLMRRNQIGGQVILVQHTPRGFKPMESTVLPPWVTITIPARGKAKMNFETEADFADAVMFLTLTEAFLTYSAEKIERWLVDIENHYEVDIKRRQVEGSDLAFE